MHELSHAGEEQIMYNKSGKFLSCKVFDDLDKFEQWKSAQNFSNHVVFERPNRMQAANFSNTHQFAVAAFEVDRGHRNGPEIHFITNMGVIVIFNKYTHRLCSVLIARPNQVRRYFDDCNLSMNAELLAVMRLAREHQIQGLNRI